MIKNHSLHILLAALCILTGCHSHSGPVSAALSETSLLTALESAASRTIETYLYADLDRDGAGELIGACRDDLGRYQIWYCSSDGTVCSLAHQDEDAMDGCAFRLLEMETEIHVAANTYRLEGTSKNYSIFSLTNHEIACLVSGSGSVSAADNGEFLLRVEAYDGIYDPEIDGMIQHTWKDTYLFFDGKEYKEYGAAQVSEETFLSYQNAWEIRAEIETKLRQPDTASLEFTYFRRNNGIFHIQCDVHKDSGEIRYGYYTVRYQDGTLSTPLGEYRSGQMAPHFSGLEVVD